MAMCLRVRSCFFFFNDTATTEIYTLSLHDALPICSVRGRSAHRTPLRWPRAARRRCRSSTRSEEHTSELQSPCNLVCRLLLEKKKKNPFMPHRYDKLKCCTRTSMATIELPACSLHW